MEQRLNLVEQDLKSHSRILTEYNITFGKMDNRLIVLEQAERNRVIVEAREDERDEFNKKRMEALEKRFDKIDAAQSKIFWAVVLAVLGAFVAFVLKGGLNV